MSSQTRSSYQQSPGASSDTTNDNELFPGYLGLNYAQQAALLWANAAAMAANASSPASSTGVSSQDNSVNQRISKAGSSSSSSMKITDNKQSKTGQRSTSSKEHQSDKISAAGAYGSGSLNAGPLDPTTMLLAELFHAQSVDNRMKELGLSTSNATTLDTQSFDKKTNSQNNPRNTDPMKRSVDCDASVSATAEALLATQMLQSLAGAQMNYERQAKHQHEKQQEASLALAAALSQETNLTGMPPGYLESLFTSGNSHTGGALDTSNRADSAGAATNLAYVRAMMMALAAACGGMKAPSGGSTSSQHGVPSIAVPPILPGGLNYDIPPFGPFGSASNGSHQATTVSPQGSGGPSESFNDVLSFLSQCLNTPKMAMDRAPNHLRSPVEQKQHTLSTPISTQRRSGRAGSSARSRGGGAGASNQHPNWEQPVNPNPTRHRGRGRPPKSASGAAHYQTTTKLPAQAITNSSSFKSPDERESYQTVSGESTSISPGRRPSSTTSTSECSIDDTIDEVLRYLAACDNDPAVVANRYASSALGIALNRKRRKEINTPTTSASSGVPTTTSGYRGEPGEVYMPSGNKRLRTSASADSNLRRPLAMGWRRETLVKGIGPGGILGEVTYVTPCGRRLWNMDSVREYLKINNVNKLSVEDFSYKSYLRLGDYFECSRGGQANQSYVKMSEAALDALMTTASLTELPDTKNVPSSSSWPGIPQADIESSQHIPFDLRSHGSLCPPTSLCGSQPVNPPILPPAAHMNSSVASMSSFKFPPNPFDLAASDLNYAAFLSSTLNGESLSVPPVAHAANDPTAIAPTAIPFLDPYSSHSSLNNIAFPMRHPLVSGVIPGMNNPWTSLHQPIGSSLLNPCLPGVPSLTGLDPTVERDCMKQFFIHLADEQIRLNDEKRACRKKTLLEQREQLLTMKVKERMEYELRKPVDDLRLLNLKPLPKFDQIENNRLSSQQFADCLLVIEFLHAFTEILCVDSETIPTMGMLQAALVDRDPACQQALLHLLIELLKFAILDPGLPSSRLVTQLIGQRFSELEVNSSTVTGLLRVFLIGRNGYEDDMSDWLQAPCHFTELSGEKQSALLAFVCDELICSSRLISTEVDRTIELQAALRREKWVLESKVRRLRFIMARKFGVTATNDVSSSDQIQHHPAPSKGSLLASSKLNDSTEMHSAEVGVTDPSRTPRLIMDEKESDSTELLSNTANQQKKDDMKSDGAKPKFYVGDTTENSCFTSQEFREKSTSLCSNATGGEATPNAATTASATNYANNVMTGDDEELEDVNQFEAKIEGILRTVEEKQHAIDECSFRLSGIYLGQDRFFRRYYVLGHSGGIYIQGSVNTQNEQPSDEMEPAATLDDDESEPGRRVDLRFGFDPDSIVAEIQARHQLAEKRRYTINIPTGHGTTHHQHVHPQVQAPATPSVDNNAHDGAYKVSSTSSVHQEGGDIHKERQKQAQELSLHNINQSTADKSSDESAGHQPDREIHSTENDLATGTTSMEISDETNITEFGPTAIHTQNEQKGSQENSIFHREDVKLNGHALKAEAGDLEEECSVQPFKDSTQYCESPTKNNAVLSCEEEKPMKKLFENNENASNSSFNALCSNLKEVEPADLEDIKYLNTGNDNEDTKNSSTDGCLNGDTVRCIENKKTSDDHLCNSDELKSSSDSGGQIEPVEPYKSTSDTIKNPDTNLQRNIQTQVSPSASESIDRCCNSSPATSQSESVEKQHAAVSCETSTPGQPLDLSTRSNIEYDYSNLNKNTPTLPSTQTSDNIYELMTNLGLDDVVLTTAALLFMTHTSIIPASVACNETLYEPWRSILAHYKSVLIWALMEESKFDSVSENDGICQRNEGTEKIESASKSLRESILVLRRSFLNNVSATEIDSPTTPGLSKDNSTTQLSDDESDNISMIAESEVEHLAEQGLMNRGIQQPPDHECVRNEAISNAWSRFTSSETLRTLVQALAPRGIRERNLAKGIRQNEEVIGPSLRVAANLDDELNYTKNGSEVELDPRFLRVRSKRGKGRGSTGTAVHLTNSASVMNFTATSSRLNLDLTPSEAMLTTQSTHNSSVSISDHAVPTAAYNDLSDFTEGPVNTADPSGNQSSSTVILEHRLRRRVSQKVTKPNNDTASGAMRSDRTAGSKSTELHTNGRSLVELVGSDDPTFTEECCVLEEVESLEDRVIAASLQVKGWQAPTKVLDDEMVQLIPRSTPKRSRFEYWPLDLAKSRLLNLEYHLERRYLLPPLSSEVHLDIVPESDSMLSGDLQHSFNDPFDGETGSESGFGGGPGSESTTTSLKDSDSLGTSGQLPQIRRVIAKQTSFNENCSTPALTSCTKNLGNLLATDMSDVMNYRVEGNANEVIPPGLVSWRQNLQSVTDVAALRECMDQLINAIAWEKSIMKVLCQICRKDSNEAQLLLCDGCDHGYHTYCFRPPLIDIPPGDWFCYDCVSKATGRQVCFVCGGCASKPFNNGVNTNSCQESGVKLLVCEQCSRTVHPCCSRPPMMRPPRRWVCANCVAQPNTQKTSKSAATGVSEMNIPGSSCSSPTGRASSTAEIASSVTSTGISMSTAKTEEQSSLSFKASSKSLKSGVRSSSLSKHARNISATGSNGVVNKLKQQCKNRVRLKTVRSKEDAIVAKCKRSRSSGEARRRKHRDRKEVSGLGTMQSFSNDSTYAHPGGEELSMDSSSHHSGRDSHGSSEYVFGREDETPKKILSPTELAWCRMVTKDLINHQSSWAFRKPVNLKQVPFYRKVIKYPMDLSTIYKKTRQVGTYSTIEEWRRDVRLIFDNCEVFNEDDSEVGRAGHTMRAYFESRWCQSSIHPYSSVPETPAVSSSASSKEQSADSPAQSTSPKSPSDIILARLKENVSTGANSSANSIPIDDMDTSFERPHSESQTYDSSKDQQSYLHPEESSPAHSNYSDGRSSGFSGFEQNECMVDLHLDDLNSPEPNCTECELATESCIENDSQSMPPTLPSEVCLSDTRVSSPL